MTKASGVFAGEVTPQAPAHNSPTSKRKGYHYFEYGVPAAGNCCAVWNVAVLIPDLHVAGEVAGVFDGEIIIGSGLLADDRIESVYTTDDVGSYIRYVGFNPGNDDGVAEVFYPECQWYNYSGPLLESIIGGGTVDFGDWTFLGGTGTTSLDQDGLDGAPNEASTATDTDTGSTYNIRSRSGLNSLNGTTAFTCRMLVRKEVSAPHYARLQLTTSETPFKSGSWSFNTQTGDLALVEVVGVDPNPFAEVRDNGGWWEVYLQVDSNGDNNNEGMLVLWPAYNLDGSPTINNVATGGITFADHTIYSETPISIVRGGCVEPKLGGADPASVIDQSNIHLDAVNHSNTEGGYYFEWRPIYSHSEISTDVEILSLNDATGLLYYDYSTQMLTATDGTNTATVPLTLAKETKYRCAVAFGSGLMRVGINGAWGVEVAYDGAFAGGSDFTVCRAPLNVNYWRELRGYRISYLDAVDELFLLMTLCEVP